jgi:hypothetical protein
MLCLLWARRRITCKGALSRSPETRKPAEGAGLQPAKPGILKRYRNPRIPENAAQSKTILATAELCPKGATSQGLTTA